MSPEEVRREERWIERRKWRDRVILGLVALAVAALPVAVISLIGTLKNETRITRVERSACAQDALSSECQAIKRASDKARSVADTCIIAEKIDRGGALLALTKCREVRERRARADAGPSGQAGTASPAGGHGATPESVSAHGPAEPKGGRGAASPAPQDAGDPQSPAPEGSGDAAPAPAGSAAATAAPPSPAPATVTPAPAEPTPPSQPSVIQSTVDRVDDAITPTVCAAAELLRGTCNP